MSSSLAYVKTELHESNCTNCPELNYKYKQVLSLNGDLIKEIDLLREENKTLKKLNKNYDDKILYLEEKINNNKSESKEKSTRVITKSQSVDSGNDDDEQDVICLTRNEKTVEVKKTNGLEENVPTNLKTLIDEICEEFRPEIKKTNVSNLDREDEPVTKKQKLKHISNKESKSEVYVANRRPKQQIYKKLNLASTLTGSNERDLKALESEGFKLSNKGNYSKAIEKFECAIKLNPQNPDSFFNKAEVYKKWAESSEKSNRNKYFKEAVLSYDKALELNKNDHMAYNSKAVCVCYLGKLDEALENYEQAIKIEPNVPAYYYNRGMTYWDHRDLENALGSVKQSIDVHFRIQENANKYNKKDLADVYYYKGKILKELNRNHEAKMAFEEANKYNKDKKYSTEIKKC